MTLTNQQEMELKVNVNKMVMNYNLGDKVENVLSSLDAAQLYDIIINDIIKRDQLPSEVEFGIIVSNILAEYVSNKFGYNDVILDTEEVLESSVFTQEMTRSVNLANQDPTLTNKVDPKKYCSELKSVIYSWYPEKISAVDLMREAGTLISKMIVEANPSLS